MSFKKGDKVICIKADAMIEVGKTYVVKKPEYGAPYSNCIEIEGGTSNGGPYYESYFELVTDQFEINLFNI